MLLDLSNCNLKSLEDSDIILEKLIELNSGYTSVTYLDVSNNYITSLKGLRCFENLKILNISNNGLLSLDGDYIPSSTEKIIAHHNNLSDICFKGIKKLSGCREEKDNKNELVGFEKRRYDDKHNGEIKNTLKKQLEDDSLNSSFYDTFSNNMINEHILYTNKNLPLNKLVYLDVSFNNIKKFTTFERYLHIINKKKTDRTHEGYSDDAHIKNFITNKTEQDVMILFFNSLETLYLRGNKLTNLKGLSVFKNLKILDLRSNLINHPVQLFYLLDNKNWLKQYNEKNFKKKNISNSYYAYFLCILQKYKDLKCLQNLFLKGNQHVLKPKHLFLSVYNVLRCANTRGGFTTDVVVETEKMDEEVEAEEVEAEEVEAEEVEAEEVEAEEVEAEEVEAEEVESEEEESEEVEAEEVEAEEVEAEEVESEEVEAEEVEAEEVEAEEVESEEVEAEEVESKEVESEKVEVEEEESDEAEAEERETREELEEDLSNKSKKNILRDFMNNFLNDFPNVMTHRDSAPSTKSLIMGKQSEEADSTDGAELDETASDRTVSDGTASDNMISGENQLDDSDMKNSYLDMYFDSEEVEDVPEELRCGFQRSWYRLEEFLKQGNGCVSRARDERGARKYRRRSPLEQNQTKARTGGRMGSETGTKIGSEKGTKIESETGTKIESEKGTKIESEKGTKIESEKGTKIESEKGTKIESEKGTKIESEKGTKIESEKGTKIESEKGTKIESETRTKIESETRTNINTQKKVQVESQKRAPVETQMVIGTEFMDKENKKLMKSKERNERKVHGKDNGTRGLMKKATNSSETYVLEDTSSYHYLKEGMKQNKGIDNKYKNHLSVHEKCMIQPGKFAAGRYKQMEEQNRESDERGESEEMEEIEKLEESEEMEKLEESEEMEEMDILEKSEEMEEMDILEEMEKLEERLGKKSGEKLDKEMNKELIEKSDEEWEKQSDEELDGQSDELDGQSDEEVDMDVTAGKIEKIIKNISRNMSKKSSKLVSSLYSKLRNSMDELRNHSKETPAVEGNEEHMINGARKYQLERVTNRGNKNGFPSELESVDKNPKRGIDVGLGLKNGYIVGDEVDKYERDEWNGDLFVEEEKCDDETADEEVTDEEAANDEVANDEVANEEAANDEVANEEVAHDEETDEEVSNNEVANDVVAHDEVTDAEVTDAEVTDAEVTDAEVTDAEVTDEEVEKPAERERFVLHTRNTEILKQINEKSEKSNTCIDRFPDESNRRHPVQMHTGIREMNVEENETSCSFSSVVKTKQKNSALKEILTNIKSFEICGSTNSSSVESDFFRDSSDEEIVPGGRYASENGSENGSEKLSENISKNVTKNVTKNVSKNVSENSCGESPNEEKIKDNCVMAKGDYEEENLHSEKEEPKENKTEEINRRGPLNSSSFKGSILNSENECKNKKVKCFSWKENSNDVVFIDGVSTTGAEGKRISYNKASGNGTKLKSIRKLAMGQRKEITETRQKNHSTEIKQVTERDEADEAGEEEEEDEEDEEDEADEADEADRAKEILCKGSTSGIDEKDAENDKPKEKKNEKELSDIKTEEDNKKLLMNSLKLNLHKNEKEKSFEEEKKTNTSHLYYSKIKNFPHYSASLKSESTDVTERDLHKYDIKWEKGVLKKYVQNSELDGENRFNGFYKWRDNIICAYPVRVQEVRVREIGGRSEREEIQREDSERDESEREESMREDSERDENEMEKSMREDSERDENEMEKSMRENSERDENEMEKSIREDSARDESKMEESEREDSERDESEREESEREDSERDESEREESEREIEGNERTNIDEEGLDNRRCLSNKGTSTSMKMKVAKEFRTGKEVLVDCKTSRSKENLKGLKTRGCTESGTDLLKKLNCLQTSSKIDSNMSNNLVFYLKEVCLMLGKEKQHNNILLKENRKLEKEVKLLKNNKEKLQKKIKNLEKNYNEKCTITKRYQNMQQRFKLSERDQMDMPDDDIEQQNKYIENAMEHLYNIFSDVLGEEHVITKRIENLANVYIKKEKKVEIYMISKRKELDLLKDVEEIVKKKNEYYKELQKKNEIINSLNSNLSKITKSVSDMKSGILENEKKTKDLLTQLSKKDSLIKELEKKNNEMVDEREKIFQKERSQLLDLLNNKDENVKSVKHYKEEIKNLEDKLKKYLDRNVHKIHDKNYEIMVDKLHDEQIKIHSLLTEKEKIINQKNIQIESLESQLQSWADEATNWVVVADKHTKLITNHNILKKNYEELKFKYIMDMKYVQTSKNEKVKELIKRYS
ncbi:hypothetical protein, conserved [Plasmodium gonderi]|uniref:Leucine-rich repeat protein n=1 Tax=Plasmodium gonderi TaxID=77519 RepID=A0A1Y1JHA4_PLAGO|nr:hypothetical protein, conserved [Plasmodium gonderi]GAW81901.1 hypothetical protein, conserved [Plasmodium gonderi]